MHTAHRSVLGQINWLQSRTQIHSGYQFSRCASKAAPPTIGDARAINKTVRTIRSIPLSMRIWPLEGNARLIGYPNASYRKNDDKSSQRAHVAYLAEERDLHKGTPQASSQMSTTHQPEQKETMHIIQMLRKERWRTDA